MKRVDELKLRVEELRDENRILREICNEHGLQDEEKLAARRHKRYFADLLARHPIVKTANGSDFMGASPIVRGISGCTGSVLCRGSIAQCFSRFSSIFQRSLATR